MRSSSDLMKVSVRMYHELWALGIETPACAFFFVNEQHQHIVLYVAFPNPRKSGLSWTSPDLVEIDDETAAARMVVPITADWEEDLGYWRQGDIWHVSRSLEEDAEVLRPFHEYFGLSGQLPNFGPEWIVNNVPFKYGWVSASADSASASSRERGRMPASSGPTTPSRTPANTGSTGLRPPS